jgi:hypothetical protein
MKRSIWALGMLGAVLTAVGPGIAMATSCVNSSGYTALSANQVEVLLGHSMACYPATGSTKWTNQEYHTGAPGVATGSVVDYKNGPATTGNKDPTATVGTYAIVGSNSGGQITYTYSTGGTFVYSVWGAKTSGSGTYDFCNGTTPLPGQVMVIVGTGVVQSCGTP